MSIEVVFFDLGDTLVKSSTRSWLPGAQELLASLRQSGLRLGILSNTGNLTDRAAILGLLPVDFDLTVFESPLVLFSSEVGVSKPDKAIFEMAITQAGVAARHCLYCSENIVETLIAQHAGMLSIRVQPPPGNDLSTLAQQIDRAQQIIGSQAISRNPLE